MLSLLLGLALIPYVLASSGNYPLLHRFLPHPQRSPIEPEWAEFGTININHEATGPSADFIRGADRTGQSDNGKGWYQLGLVVGDTTYVSSVKSCYTAAPQIYNFVISLDGSSPAAVPTGIQLDLSYGIPSNGSCPSGWYEQGDKVVLPQGINTAVHLKSPHRAAQIALHPPPSLDPGTGKPAEPVVEKTFIQKYWMPMLGLGLFVMAQMGPDKPPQAGGGGSS